MKHAPEPFIKLINAIAQPVLVKDSAYRLVFANDAFCALLGRSRQEMAGETCLSFLPEHQAEFIRQADETVLSTGQDHSQEEVWTDSKARIHSVRAKRILLHIEREKYVFCALEEISGSRQFRYSGAGAEHLHTMLDNIGEGVITADTLGMVKVINRAAQEITGWTAEEAEGRPLAEVLHFLEAEMQRPLYGMLDKLLASGTRVHLPSQLMLQTRSGAFKFIGGTFGPIKARDNRTIGAVFIFRDITEKQKIEIDRINAEKLESVAKFAGSIAHDLGNLLTGISGFIELAQYAAPAESTKIRTNLNRALEVLSKAKGLAWRLQTQSKGGAPVRFPTSPANLLQQSVEMSLGGRNVEWQLQLPQDLWPCDIDENQIGLAIHHVLNNARQAMPKGGRILIRARNTEADKEKSLPLGAGKCVAIEIQDHGSGIPPEFRDRIFDPFFTTREKGSGLGLTIARSILANHLGHIEVNSVPGEGTTVTLYLPAAETCHPAVPAPVPAAEFSRGRILVMDDEEAVRIAMSRLLKNLGYTVATARDAEEAAERYHDAMINGQPFAAVILDLMLETGGATAALSQLKQIDPAVKAIAASGYVSDPIISEPEKAGFRASIKKPFNSSELDAVLRSVLGF